VSVPGSTPDIDELETDLVRILRDQYDTEIAYYEPSPHERSAFAARSRTNINRVLAMPRHPNARSLRVATRPVPWFLTAAALAAILLGLSMSWFGRGSFAAFAATPPILDIAGANTSRYPLTGSDPTEELEKLADLAANSPNAIRGLSSGVSVGPDRTHDAQHVEVASWWLETTSERDHHSSVIPTDTQRYVLPDGVVRLITHRGRPMTGTSTSAPGPGPVTSREAFRAAAASGPLSNPAKLPLEPTRLRATLLGNPRECAGEEGYCLSNAIQTLALTHVLSPQLNASLLRAMIGSSDLRYAGRAVDRAGRPSEVFVVNDPDRDRQRLLLFDTDTGAYNGDETILVKDSEELGVKAPAVIGFDAVITREWIPAGAVPQVKEGRS